MTIEDLAQSIARFEGYYTPGSLPQRNNNPGSLRSWGSLPTRDGYVVFPTPEAGWGALHRQVSLNIGRDLTLYEFFAGKPGVYPGYAPSADANDPGNYARTVAGWLGIDPSKRLSGYVSTGAACPAEGVDEALLPLFGGTNCGNGADEAGGQDLLATDLTFGVLGVGLVALGVWWLWRD